MFCSIANRVEFASFLVYRLFRNTKYIFRRTFSPVIINLRKVPKEINNIIMSHLFTSAVFRVFAVQCEIWTKVVFAHRPRKKKTTLLNDNEFGVQKQKTGETQANYTVVRFFFVDCFFMSFIMWRCFVIVAYSASRLFKWSKGFFSVGVMNTRAFRMLFSRYKQT